MEQPRKNIVLRLLGFGWSVIDVGSRAIIAMVVVGLVVFLALASLFGDGKPKVDKNIALLISPRGALVEQLTGSSFERAMDELTGRAQPETLLRDVLHAIELAKDDKRIKGIVLELNGVGSTWPTKLEDLGRALVDFRESGKKVIAVADNYSTTSYFLAAHADEIILHPMGMVLIDGYSRYRMYYREAMEKLELDMHVFKVGKFKSAVEPYLRNDMSPEAREANLDFLGDLWNAWLDGVATARGIEGTDLEKSLDSFLEAIEKYEGDAATVALETGLVDKLMSRIEAREYLAEMFGKDEDSKSYKRIGHGGYLEARSETKFATPHGGPAVAVVVARGLIQDGSAPPGSIGGDTVAAMIRKAREDEKVKAIVLRVDSGGGSAFASEVIRREFEKARADGMPVVVSMGSVAASGGYWISTSADEIWAHPTTITGSIGIFGTFPTYNRTMAKAGLHTDGVGTTAFSGALRGDLPMRDEIGEAIQLMVEQGYREFLDRVSKARNMTREEVHEIAQGRVWSGLDAFELGLVDNLGTFHDAIESAAKLAELEDDYRVRFLEHKREWHEELMGELFSKIAATVGPVAERRRSPLVEQPVWRELMAEAERLARMNDPRGMHAYAFIE